ncbi:MAG: hypothetical protein AB1815_10335 [Bacillota bacterium]
MDSANIQRGLNPPLNEVSFNCAPHLGIPEKLNKNNTLSGS